MCTRARCLRRHHRKPARKKKENATETQHYAIQSEWALVRTHTPFVITAVRRPGRLGEGAAGVRLYRWKRIASLLLPAQTARNYKLFPRREEKCLSSSFFMFYNTEALMSASQLGFHYIEFFFLFLSSLFDWRSISLLVPASRVPIDSALVYYYYHDDYYLSRCVFHHFLSFIWP